MTQPQNTQERLAALETAMGTLRDSFGKAIVRLTGAEESLAAGGPRLQALEEAAQGFTSRVGSLEEDLAGRDRAVSDHNDRLGALEAQVQELLDTVTRLGQITRPARTVMRERLESLQGAVDKILERLPEDPAETTDGSTK